MKRSLPHYERPSTKATPVASPKVTYFNASVKPSSFLDRRVSSGL